MVRDMDDFKSSHIGDGSVCNDGLLVSVLKICQNETGRSIRGDGSTSQVPHFSKTGGSRTLVVDIWYETHRSLDLK